MSPRAGRQLPQAGAAASKDGRSRRTTAGGRQGGQTPSLPAAVPPTTDAHAYTHARGALLAQFGAAVGALDGTIATVDHKIVVEILHKNDGDVLTDAEARTAFLQLVDHAEDLKAANDEGGTAEPDEVRDTLVKIAREAFALIRTFDACRRASDARDMHQGEASL